MKNSVNSWPESRELTEKEPHPLLMMWWHCRQRSPRRRIRVRVRLPECTRLGSGPAKRITADAMEDYFRAYTDFFETDDAATDFNSGYYVFADGQNVLTTKLAMHESLAARMRAFHDELVRIRDEQAARPTVIPRTGSEPAKLYRKMSTEEAAQILDARNAAAGITAAMAYNRSDEYRKFFTTSLSHTSVFSNANAASETEVVVEFTLPWNNYWAFAGRFGTPNQQTGAYQIRDSALIHQERLRTGAGANFRSTQDVDTVMADRTHHNIGIGHGNAREFASLVTARRQVPPGEVAQAATDALEDARQARQPAIDALIQQQLAPLRQREADATVHAAPLTAPRDDRSAVGSDGGALDVPDVEDIPDARGFRRTGARTAVLDGTAFTLDAASGTTPSPCCPRCGTRRPPRSRTRGSTRWAPSASGWSVVSGTARCPPRWCRCRPEAGACPFRGWRTSVCCSTTPSAPRESCSAVTCPSPI